MNGRGAIEAAGLVAGFGIWSLAFVLLYGWHGFACAQGLAPAVARTGLFLLFGLHLMAHAALIWWFHARWSRPADPPLRFVRLASLVLAIGAMGTTLGTGLPALVLRLC